MYVHVCRWLCLESYVYAYVYTDTYLLAMFRRLGRCGLEDSFKSFFKSDPRMFSGNSFMILKSNKLFINNKVTLKNKYIEGVNQHQLQ